MEKTFKEYTNKLKNNNRNKIEKYRFTNRYPYIDRQLHEKMETIFKEKPISWKIIIEIKERNWNSNKSFILSTQHKSKNKMKSHSNSSNCYVCADFGRRQKS